jgi:mRNA interferase YafQ
MLQPSYTKQFEKDWKRLQKRGKSKEKLKKVLGLLINEEQLPQSCKDHRLIGNFKGRRECHIEPDWLLIYKITESIIIFERTGSHADLFR